MIISEQKPFPEILKSLEGEKSIFIVGCKGCAEACHTGGEPQVLEMKQKLDKIDQEQSDVEIKERWTREANEHFAKQDKLR